MIYVLIMQSINSREITHLEGLLLKRSLKNLVLRVQKHSLRVLRKIVVYTLLIS